eukprot:36223-Chlamydomonas_euryale.AAC.11
MASCCSPEAGQCNWRKILRLRSGPWQAMPECTGPSCSCVNLALQTPIVCRSVGGKTGVRRPYM